MDRHGYGENEATLGDRLTAAREFAGLSVAELAERLGVRDTALEAWEGDQAEPGTVFLGRLPGMLGVSLVWLLTGEGQGPQEGGDRSEATRAELRELRRLLDQAALRVDRLEELMANG